MDTPSNEWYSSIAKLPLSKFIDVVVDGNLQALVITGKPDNYDLQLAWQDIQIEYSDSIGDAETKLYNNLTAQATKLRITLQIIEESIKILEKIYYKKFADGLNEILKTNFVFDPKDPETYRKNLKACFSRSRGIKIDLHIKESRLEAMNIQQDSKTFKYTREYFQSALITISDHAKYQIVDMITVFEYCERLKRYNNYYEALNRKGRG